MQWLFVGVATANRNGSRACWFMGVRFAPQLRAEGLSPLEAYKRLRFERIQSLLNSPCRLDYVALDHGNGLVG